MLAKSPARRKRPALQATQAAADARHAQSRFRIRVATFAQSR
jgi:hypothetical protein